MRRLQPEYLGLDAGLLAYLAYHGFPRRLTGLDSAAWSVPEIYVGAMAQQDFAALVQDGREGTGPQHDQQR